MYPYEQAGSPAEVSASGKSTKHPLHEREIQGSLQFTFGGGSITGLTIGTILLWLLFQPTGQLTSMYLGEMLGTIAILLFSCSLIVATKAPFLESFFGGLDEISMAAAQYPTFRPHITYSKREGSLTIERIAASSSGALADREIYMSGPSRMIQHFQRAFRTRGVPSSRIHYEHFDFR